MIHKQISVFNFDITALPETAIPLYVFLENDEYKIAVEINNIKNEKERLFDVQIHGAYEEIFSAYDFLNKITNKNQYAYYRWF